MSVAANASPGLSPDQEAVLQTLFALSDERQTGTLSYSEALQVYTVYDVRVRPTCVTFIIRAFTVH